MLFAQKNPSVAPSSDYDVRDSLKEFTEVYSIVEANYAEPLDADKAIYDGAIPRSTRTPISLIRKPIRC